MNYEQYMSFITPHTAPTITIDFLKDRRDRTLLYGYTLERNSHHVYVKDETLHLQ